MPMATPLPNKVHMPRWYERVKRSGLNYGDYFRTVEEMNTTSSGSKGMCNGKLRNDPYGDEANYHVHPTAVDTCFQLLGAAANHGTTHGYRQLIPLSVDYMAVSRCSNDHIQMNAICEALGDGIEGEVTSRTNSGVFLRIQADSTKVPITARSEWVPHIDFSDIKELVKPVRNHAEYMPTLESLAQLAALLSKRILSAMERSSSMPHMDTDALTHSIASLVTRLEKTPAAPASMAVVKICNNITSILSEQTTGLQTLDTEDVLPNLYRFIGEHDVSNFLRCLAQSKPNLRILELGTGLGPMLNGTWDDLRRSNGQVLYSQYVYVEAVPALTTAAEKRFRKGIPNLEFATLDIKMDPDEQRFEHRDFDLVIANGVIHITPSVRMALGYLRKLLRPGLTWTKYVLGTLPEWWCGADDGRPDEPYVQPSVWHQELTASGFQGMCVIGDSPEPFHLNSIMVARVAILHRIGETSGVDMLATCLGADGFQTTTFTLEDTIPDTAQDVISLLDFPAPFLENIENYSFENSNSCFRGSLALGRSHNPDLRYAPIIGLSRTIRSEMGIDFATCETDELCAPGSTFEHAINVFSKFHERETNGVIEHDFEYLITTGITYVSRFFPFSLEEEKMNQEKPDEGTLNIGTPGRLESLYWASVGVLRAPVGDEVEVVIHAAGLNLRLRSGDPPLGCEASGVIRRIGPNVKKFHVGDRVILLGQQTFATVLTLPELLCEKLPPEVNFVEGASLPVVFATAIQSLINVARLEKDQSVLIHSGCGGVGIAAIQIARMIGAQIFTTVSSEDKVKYLMENFNIPRNHIFNSRQMSFVADLMRETRGRGVDVALNSLSGEFLHGTWRCIANFGTMIEIDKKDILERGKLDMKAFQANRSYCCVDVYQMGQERPGAIERILMSMMEYHRKGFITPVVLAKVYPPSAIVDAMRYMQQGSHIGKICISIRHEITNKLQVKNIAAAYSDSNMFDPTASYLLVGGLGGLGSSVSVWMAQRGARYLTLMSRHAGESAADVDLIRRLESMGCSIRLVRGSVANERDVSAAINGAPKPLREEWNDAISPKVQGTWNLHKVLQAQGLDIDFFVLLSSLSGIFGQVGQANYAVTNTFLDSFVKYRTNMGLPCAAIDVGAMEGVGYLSENETLLKRMQGIGWRPVTEEQFFEALEATLRSFPMSMERGVCKPSSWTETLGNDGNMLLGVAPIIPLGDVGSSARLRKDTRMAVYHNTNQQKNGAGGRGDGGDSTLELFLSAAKKDPVSFRQPEAAKVLAREIGRKLFMLLLKPEQEPDIALELTELGLDPMIAVELRAWWKLELGLAISVLEMLAMGTLLALGKKAADELADKYEGLAP
ncbi:hypothetical protein F4802DRAFT_610078 [Xylaria palmicola]|nr:hypothetical protein F4802DRAFT_610078 [Xylaria palmicola]